MNKKNLLPCFALMIAIIPSNNTYVVSAEVNECISNADINLITAQHVLTNYGTDVSPLNIIPLYDIEDNLIAYNVNLDNGAYLIINSNKNNPIITEFGETQYISPSNSKQYYINPLIVESDLNSLNDSKIRTSSENDNPFYNFLKSNNSNKKTEYENLKEKIYSNTSYNLTSSMTKEVDNDDYDFFLYSADLKPTAYSETYINYANSLVAKWKNMTTFATLNDVHDHCAATSAYNLIYYYKYINNDTLPITTSEIHQLFLDIHDYIGNGPVIPLQFRNRLKDYLEDETDYNYTIEQLGETWINYKNEIDNNNMVNLCYMANLLSAHMVNGVGYREYANENYCIIYNNWDMAAYRYVLFDISELYRISKVDIYI